MEVLTLNGQKYVKASKAARDLGYASDYVGQLCRKGAVDAHLVGRTWYVNPDTLGAHRVEKKRNARVKAREHARRSIEEARSLKVGTGSDSQKKVAIHYEGDEEGLIPEVRKVEIDSYQERAVASSDEKGDEFSIENKDKKIIMSGKVAVHDAELEEEYTDTTILTPRILRHRRPAAFAIEETRAQETLPEKKPASFEERVALSTSHIEPQEAQEDGMEDEAPHSVEEEVVSRQTSAAGGYLLPLFSLCLVILAIGTVFLASSMNFHDEVIDSSLILDISTVSNFVK